MALDIEKRYKFLSGANPTGGNAFAAGRCLLRISKAFDVDNIKYRQLCAIWKNLNVLSVIGY